LTNELSDHAVAAQLKKRSAHEPNGVSSRAKRANKRSELNSVNLFQDGTDTQDLKYQKKQERDQASSIQNHSEQQ
jgi:hypothetical protein